MRHITMLGSYPPLRAISSYCLELTQAMAKHADIDFLSFDHLYPARLYPGGGLQADTTFPDIRIPGLRVHRYLNWYDPASWIRAGLHAPARILHAQWWSLPLACIYGCICSCFKMRRIPVVFTVHNVLSHDNNPAWVCLSRMVFRLGDHFIVHTEKNKQQLQETFRIPPGKITVIPHGMLQFQIRTDADTQQTRADMGFAPDEQIILLFGAVRPYKGIGAALRAMALAAPKLPRVKLLIAGKLWGDWQPYAQLIRDLGLDEVVKTRLEYIPANAVHRYFEIADLVLLPYLHFDSQSGVGATALAFQKPMIVSNVGGLKDFVPPGHAVAPDNPQALATAIMNFFTDPAERDCIKAHLVRIRQEYAWPSIAEKTLRVYRKVLENARSTTSI